MDLKEPTTLTDYLNRHKQRIVRKPAWIRRMDEKGLPDKDLTAYNGAFVPRGSNGAA
jgi:hypothetical protein